VAEIMLAASPAYPLFSVALAVVGAALTWRFLKGDHSRPL
jgi:hypothetical protein